VQTSIEPVTDVAELSAISVQPSALSEMPSAQAPPIGRRAELIDAAIAVELIRNGQNTEAPSLDEEPAFAETYADHVFAAEAIAPASPFVDTYERPGTSSSADDAAEDAWLTEKLLERVFG